MGGVANDLVQFGLAPIDRASASEARRMMALSLLDWVSVGVAGSREPVSQILRDLAVESGGAAQASVIGCPQTLPAAAAALVNGTVSHALDYDDTHFAHIGHPSVAVLPAAIAMAETTGASGAHMLDAALIGVEASIRVGCWLGRTHYETGFHQTATAGAFGACVAAGRLAGLTAAQMSHALGLCATRATGLKSQFGTMGKPYHAGLAAQTGVEVVRAAKAGFTSTPESIDGPQGFGPTHAGEDNRQAFDGLGVTWDILTISHKFHACCHGTHAMLEALAGINCPADEVAELQLWTHPRWLSVCNIPHPATGLEVKFSYAHLAAMALSGVNTAALDSFSDAIAQDPDLIRLAARVHVSADDNLPETAALVELTSTTGALFTRDHNLNAPMSLAQRQAKIVAKSRALLGAQSDQVFNAIRAGPDLPVLTGLLRAA